VVPVPHELLFRIPGCCSMLYEWPWRVQSCAPNVPWVAIHDPRVLFYALWVAMGGPKVLSVPHEWLFRISGCYSMLYLSDHGGSRLQRCSQCPMSCYSWSQGAALCFMGGHGGSIGAPNVPWVAIQDPRVLFYALWVTMEGPEVLPVPHELLFRIPGCCSMLYEWPWRVQSRGAPNVPWVAIFMIPGCCSILKMGGHGWSRGAPSTPWVAIQDPCVLFFALTLTSNVMKHFLVTESE